jgi:putative heme iron utilization protein
VADREAIDRARGLLRGANHGALATLDRRNGAPIATLVAVATDRDGAPLLLLSDLAEHTKNLARDPRVSLLLDGTQGLQDRLTGARLTVVARTEATDDAAAAARYGLRHPQSAMYAGFGDFHLYRLVIERAHLVAGFGRIDRIEGSDLMVAPGLVVDLAAIEPGAIAHMHDDHHDALVVLAGAAPGEDVALAAIDADGFDLSCAGRPRRIEFAGRLTSVSDLRTALAASTRAARRHAAGNDPD